MTRDPATSSSSSIYQDGDPVSITLTNESTTVPSGETWVIDLVAPIRSSDAQSQVLINGETVATEDFHDSSFSTVVKDGDTIGTGDFFTVHVGGWSL